MDHVIGSMKSWLCTFEDFEPKDEQAIECIKKAIRELEKYYEQDSQAER